MHLKNSLFYLSLITAAAIGNKRTSNAMDQGNIWKRKTRESFVPSNIRD